MIFVYTYFDYEIPWVAPVCEQLTGDQYRLYSPLVSTLQRAVNNKFAIADEDISDSCDTLLISQTHMQDSPKRIKDFYESGRNVVILQRAWDSAIHLVDNFWNNDTSQFTRFCVGGDQDWQWLSDKYGQERVINTGIPRFDYLTNNPKQDDGYYLVTTLADYSHETHQSDSFYNDLLSRNLQYIYKLHPGCTFGDLPSKIGDSPLYADNDDLNFGYDLILNCHALVTCHSFMMVEATIAGKPVILKGDIRPAALKEYERNNHSQRIPSNFSSEFGNEYFTEGQAQMKLWYRYDGKCTERVLDVLSDLKSI